MAQRGPRHLWTDACGVVLLVSLYRAWRQPRYLEAAEQVVADVQRVLGRPLGLRSAEGLAGQSFRHLALWAYALGCLGQHRPAYRERAVALLRDVHPRFVVPAQGVYATLRDDLSGPLAGSGFGALEPFLGYVLYRWLDAQALAREIAELQALVEGCFTTVRLHRDLELGLMLWLTHFFPTEAWAHTQCHYALEGLEPLWVDPPGYFCREPHRREETLALSNYVVSLGLQAVGRFPDRVAKLHVFFGASRGRNPADAATGVMACVAHFPGAFVQPLAEAVHV
ncbi:MAG: hypothetical protein KatS3mg131_3547 [Candidatus Tectimicrobiota bacterium]|nr:MAG: hypothetical protein KatS3mg131_3547 [Candidatus Tectomicrobia bacterium]